MRDEPAVRRLEVLERPEVLDEQNRGDIALERGAVEQRVTYVIPASSSPSSIMVLVSLGVLVALRDRWWGAS